MADGSHSRIRKEKDANGVTKEVWQEVFNKNGNLSIHLEVCKGIENGALTPKQGDDYFTLLDLYLDDNYPDLDLGEVLGDLLFEGMSLHDLGESYGADLDVIRELAHKMGG